MIINEYKEDGYQITEYDNGAIVKVKIPELYIPEPKPPVE